MKRLYKFILLLMIVCSIFVWRDINVLAVENSDNAYVDEETGLYIQVPKDVQITLHNGFNGSGKSISPTECSVEDGVASYYYYELPVGTYSYVATGTGYYSVTKNIYYSSEKASLAWKIDANPGKCKNSGFEVEGDITMFTQEVVEKLLPSSTALWPDYEEIFDIPYFTNGHGRYEMTSQNEMMEFLKRLDDESDLMKLYVIGNSPFYDYEIPVAVFTTTDISSAKTVEEAAALINNNGKTTIHYQAQIHGNEPASGDAALSMIKMLCGNYGNEVLGKINIYVIPRMNPDGSYDFQRRNVANNVDMNRDHMKMQSDEVALLHKIYNLFTPEVTIDGHEYRHRGLGEITGSLDDVQIAAAENLYYSEEMLALIKEIVSVSFQNVESQGLRSYYYTNGGIYVSSANYNIGREYYGLAGSMSFLIETMGLDKGFEWYERRIASQYISVESIINYVVEHEQTIRKVVEENRQEIINLGLEYDEDDVLILQHSSTKKPDSLLRPMWDFADGSVYDADAEYSMYHKDIVSRVRVRPTAYVLPKEDVIRKKVMPLLDKHGIFYYEVGEDSKVELQQYIENKNEVYLSEEQSITFEKGAYVIPLNQTQGNVAAMLLEPDVTDVKTNKGTLVQSGIINPDAKGEMPIYRYVQNLEDGKIKVTTNIKDDQITYEKKLVYTGKVLTPSFTIIDAQGNELIQGTDYTYKVYDSKNNVVKSPIDIGEYQVKITFKGIYYGKEILVYRIVPARVKDFEASLSGGHDDVKLTWDKSDGASGYYVSYKKSSTTKYTSQKRTSKTYYTIKDLSDGVAYDFRVVPYYLKNDTKYYANSEYEYTTLKTSKNVKAPSTITLNPFVEYNDVKASWSKSSGASGYVVYYKEGSAEKYTRLTDTTKRNTTDAIDLTDGAKYTFKIVPYYYDGDEPVESYYSKTKTIYILKKLDKPKVTKSSSKVKVQWNNISGETGYQISRGEDPEETKIVSTYNTTTGKSKTISATKGKTYYYKVRAYRTVNGEKVPGPWSDVVKYTRK